MDTRFEWELDGFVDTEFSTKQLGGMCAVVTTAMAWHLELHT
jgi:hypothetical protein